MTRPVTVTNFVLHQAAIFVPSYAEFEVPTGIPPRCVHRLDGVQGRDWQRDTGLGSTRIGNTVGSEIRAWMRGLREL